MPCLWVSGCLWARSKTEFVRLYSKQASNVRKKQKQKSYTKYCSVITSIKAWQVRLIILDKKGNTMYLHKK